jgi:hypothetical protein
MVAIAVDCCFAHMKGIIIGKSFEHAAETTPHD